MIATQTRFYDSNWLRSVRTAAPALLLAAAVQLSFLNKAYTIDDPVFLHEAEHVLRDPLHPTAFEMVWANERRVRASQFIPGGPAAAYILVPVVLLGRAEWVAHLLQVLILAVGVVGTVALAYRLGWDQTEARTAALLIAASPAVLVMASTSMPDVAGLTFAALAMERQAAYIHEHRRGQAVAAAVWVALAALTRMHLLLLVGVGIILAMAAAQAGRRVDFRKAFRLALPMLAGCLLFVLALIITRDPAPGAGTTLSATKSLLQKHAIGEHFLSYLSGLALTMPFTLPLLAAWVASPPSNFRRGGVALGLPRILVTCAAVLLGLLGLLSERWLFVVAGVSLLTVGALVRMAVRGGDLVNLALLAWMLIPVSLLVYIIFGQKYLVPCAPAIALLVSRELGHCGPRVRRIIVGATVSLGSILAVLIIRADAAMAQLGRNVAEQVILTRRHSGQTVWFAGHWGFHWYAEHAGALVVSKSGPYPQPGDIVVSSTADLSQALCAVPHRRLVEIFGDTASAGQIMSRSANAGFYDTYWGDLPWAWGKPEGPGFMIWQVMPPLVTEAECGDRWSAKRSTTELAADTPKQMTRR